jgi:hypothetical protein
VEGTDKGDNAARCAGGISAAVELCGVARQSRTNDALQPASVTVAVAAVLADVVVTPVVFPGQFSLLSFNIGSCKEEAAAVTGGKHGGAGDAPTTLGRAVRSRVPAAPIDASEASRGVANGLLLGGVAAGTTVDGNDGAVAVPGGRLISVHPLLPLLLLLVLVYVPLRPREMGVEDAAAYVLGVVGTVDPLIMPEVCTATETPASSSAGVADEGATGGSDSHI